MTQSNEKNNPIKNIIFDYGGVFTNGSRTALVSKALGKTSQEQATIRQFFSSNFVKQAARGEWTTSELIAHLQSYIEHARSELICQALGQACAADAQMLRLVERLKRRYQVYLISDSLPPYSDFINLHYSPLFEQLFLSDRIGVRKSEGLFQQAQRACAHLYEQTIYIDDREKNLKLLEDKGVTGMLFTSYKKLIADLQQHGIILD